MSFEALRELASRTQPRGRNKSLEEKYPFVPWEIAKSVPPGWIKVLLQAVRRMSAAVPKNMWTNPFHITFIGLRDGRLHIDVEGGSKATEAIIRKMKRACANICMDCGKPATSFVDRQGMRTLCPDCIAAPLLLRDLDAVLWWRSPATDPSGDINPARLPRSLGPSFAAWRKACANADPIQPWELHTWLSDIDRAHQRLAR